MPKFGLAINCALDYGVVILARNWSAVLSRLDIFG